MLGVTRNLALDVGLNPRHVWLPVIIVSGEQERGSISMAYSPSGSNWKWEVSRSHTTRISWSDRNVGVPPPQCIWRTRRSSPASAACMPTSMPR